VRFHVAAFNLYLNLHTAVFAHLGCTVEWHRDEGSVLDPAKDLGGKVKVATVRGPCRLLLLGERTALNSLSRASGVATESAECVAVARAHGWHGHVAGTRKTTPGFRIVEKYALLVGGAATHRLDLSNMVMLKDNHIWSAGSIASAVALAKKAAGFSSKIEVECRGLEEGLEAAAAGADIVMFDNMEPGPLKLAAGLLKASFPHVTVEASGGITLATMPSYFSPHVDVISQGRLTQGYTCLDFSLKINKSPGGGGGGGGGGDAFSAAAAAAGAAAASAAAAAAMYSSIGMGAAAEAAEAGGKKKRKKRTPKAELVPVPGAYRCIKQPAIAFRTTSNVDDRDEGIAPVQYGERVNGCVELPASEGSWLRVEHPIAGARFLPMVLNGDRLFEPVTEAMLLSSRVGGGEKRPRKPYEVPENQKHYVVFTQIQRPKLKQAMPDCPRGDLNKELGKMWRLVPAEEKKTYTPELLSSLGLPATLSSALSPGGGGGSEDDEGGGVSGEDDDDDDDEGAEAGPTAVAHM